MLDATQTNTIMQLLMIGAWGVEQVGGWGIEALASTLSHMDKENTPKRCLTTELGWVGGCFSILPQKVELFINKRSAYSQSEFDLHVDSPNRFWHDGVLTSRSRIGKKVNHP